MVGNFLAGLHWKRQNVSGLSGNIGAISGSLFEDYFRKLPDCRHPRIERQIQGSRVVEDKTYRSHLGKRRAADNQAQAVFIPLIKVIEKDRAALPQEGKLLRVELGITLLNIIRA